MTRVNIQGNIQVNNSHILNQEQRTGDNFHWAWENYFDENKHFQSFDMQFVLSLGAYVRSVGEGHTLPYPQGSSGCSNNNIDIRHISTRK